MRKFYEAILWANACIDYLLPCQFIAYSFNRFLCTSNLFLEDLMDFSFLEKFMISYLSATATKNPLFTRLSKNNHMSQ